MRNQSSRPHLTAAQRGRLRPTVDVGALERFLAVVPRESRQFYFLACTQTVTNAELQAVGIIPPPAQQHRSRLPQRAAASMGSERISRRLGTCILSSITCRIPTRSPVARGGAPG